MSAFFRLLEVDQCLVSYGVLQMFFQRHALLLMARGATEEHHKEADCLNEQNVSIHRLCVSRFKFSGSPDTNSSLPQKGTGCPGHPYELCQSALFRIKVGHSHFETNLRNPNKLPDAVIVAEGRGSVR
jgi:hypothetical protein